MVFFCYNKVTVTDVTLAGHRPEIGGRMERGEGRSAKAAIVEALVQLSNERPFEEISITEITRRAGVSRMAFYRSYRSKGEVLEQQAAELSSSLHRLAVPGETAEARLTRCFTFLREERARLTRALEALGLWVCPSDANFILFQGPTDLGERLLREENILIRDCGNYSGLGPGWYRIGLQGKAENTRLLQALERLLPER